MSIIALSINTPNVKLHFLKNFLGLEINVVEGSKKYPKIPHIPSTAIHPYIGVEFFETLLACI